MSFFHSRGVLNKDYSRAQKLLDAQLNARRAPLLTGFLLRTFPTMFSYYWILWQNVAGIGRALSFEMP